MATLKEKLEQLEAAKHLLGDQYEALKQEVINSFVKGPAPTVAKHKEPDYLDIMDEISSPSKWAREWIKDSKQKNGRLFRNHRPANASDIPIQFYHRIFETFINLYRIAKYQRGNVNLYLNWHLSCPVHFQMKTIGQMLSDAGSSYFLINEIEIRPEEANIGCQSSRTGERRTDGSIYPKIGRDRVLLVNLEVKPEPGTNGDSYIQNSAYYKEFVIKSRKEKSEFYNKTCLPAFLINLDGPYLSISGAVSVPFMVWDRLTDIFPLDMVTYDHTKADYIARILLALKNTMDIVEAIVMGERITTVSALDPHNILRKYYTSVCESREISNEPLQDNRWFPCINKIDLEEGTATIKYKERHSIYRSLWIVEIQAKNMQEKGLVKYTQKYFKEAHDMCFKLGLAPKLWAINNLQQRWHIVFMEYLEEYQPLHTYDSELFFQTKNIVKNAMKLFHDSGYVHGDLRDENIMIKCENGKIDIKFVDFDWAGREGEAKYPESLNPTINWHPDAGWHKLIKKEHDHHLVDNIYLNIKPDKSSKKQRRLSEWMN